MFVDASKVAVSAALIQAGENNFLHPIAYYFKALKS